MDIKKVRAGIKTLWGRYKNKEDKLMGHNIFVVKLNSEPEQKDAIKRGPWIINDEPFGIKNYNNELKPE